MARVFSRLIHSRANMSTSALAVGQSVQARSGSVYFISKVIQTRPDGPYGIYKALVSGRQYVLKTVSQGQLEKGITIWSRLQQSNVNRLPIDTILEPKGFIFEYCDEDLQAIAKRVKFNREQIKHIARAILEAISEIHNTDHLHGDIKAENVMLNYYYKAATEVDITGVYLIDCENAYPVKDGEYAFGLKIGHPFWRSPEALVGRVVGKPTDIFSFGILIAFLLLGGKTHILDAGVRTIDEDEIQSIGLERICNYFGRYEKTFAKRLDEGQSVNLWEQVMAALNETTGTGEPFFSINPRQVHPEDSAFVWSFMSIKDPLERPSAVELLQNRWFTA